MPEQSALIHHRVTHVPRHKRVDELNFPGGADLITELRHHFPNGENEAKSGSFSYRGVSYDAEVHVQKYGVPNSLHAGWSIVFDRSKAHRAPDHVRAPQNRAILIITPPGTTFLTTRPPEMVTAFMEEFARYIADPKANRDFILNLESEEKLKPKDGKKLSIQEEIEQKRLDLVRQKHKVEMAKIATSALQAKSQTT